LQYQAVRIKSLLRKAADAGYGDAPLTISSDSERQLALALLRLPDAVALAQTRRAPNVLCDHAFEVAQAYSRFYGEHHIMSMNDAAVRGGKLALCRAVLSQLTLVLGLLGIEVPERM
jgi:arginyl-tRNA synthetase